MSSGINGIGMLNDGYLPQAKQNTEKTDNQASIWSKTTESFNNTADMFKKMSEKLDKFAEQQSSKTSKHKTNKPAPVAFEGTKTSTPAKTGLDFSVNNNKAYIDGSAGPYTSEVKDTDVAYGRNAVANEQKYLESLKNSSKPSGGFDMPDINEDLTQPGALEKLSANLDKMKADLDKPSNNVPLDFEMKYLPGTPQSKNLNTKAALGAGYEDMGKKEISVAEMDEGFKKAGMKNATAAAFDINGDGKISYDENTAALLIKDMADAHSSEQVLKTGEMNLDAKDLDGKITNSGETNFNTFLNPKQVEQSKNTIKAIYDAFGLGKAKEQFEKEPNNTLNLNG